MDTIKIGILTLSDRASSGIYEDKATSEVEKILTSFIKNKIDYFKELIPDDYDLIIQKLLYLSDEKKCDLIITSGGTGPALRDVTPEATEAVCDKMMPGFGELMRLESLKYVPTAILSRQTAGIRNKTLIVNLPGNPKAIMECLKPIFPAIPYCIDLIGGSYIENNDEIIKIFRPKKC
ncbi:molybdopterin adenylyltransferase [Campylobacter sp. LH-2024]|uniref:molybdopterin adenylyltransferase n=1 Tax=Campylobacter TaxID=194 RepID=UPI0019034208|nr:MULTISPECIES: molybdopterin adenylyltransferase [unclassified Campylobacter]MBZ7930484.1 molybdopterin adenylyltransferase [Campylobacter sp. W0067]MBZ7931512.1 molybdopterin adenylyltransferase [Campylobacter sp. RM12910]MBZ7933358.1 molybdopterin adenylyltransferase [Campylobacter sp. RM10543]MBZ7934929.1 molybdopterin adenylyltransferase [Campylobacter sp. W0065]MBZ7937564.1 molybdopterin adenylyltransferase [Campylobacter sp. RM10538]MBZ7941209.1 molybdopterin adenylyltransferase [Camp